MFNCPKHGLSRGVFCPSCQPPVKTPEKTPEQTQAEKDVAAYRAQLLGK